MTDPITYGLAGAIVAGAATAGGAAIKAWVDGKRVDQVDGPRTTNEAWRVIFDTMQEQISALGRRVAGLEVDLRSAHDTIAERDRTIAERDAMIDHTNSVLRRLRSYVALVTSLLAQHSIPFPPAPDDDGLAPERRGAIAATVAVQVPTTVEIEQEHR